jgi:hypothetical protein
VADQKGLIEIVLQFLLKSKILNMKTVTQINHKMKSVLVALFESWLLSLCLFCAYKTIKSFQQKTKAGDI